MANLNCVLSHEKMVSRQCSLVSLNWSNLVTTLTLPFLAKDEKFLSCAEMDVVFTLTDMPSKTQHSL